MEAVAVIAKIRAGKADAFEEIVVRYQAAIVRYLYRLTGDGETAQDLAQDTFIQAYRNILKTNSDISLKAWLYRIATNNARQYYRRKKIVSFVPFGDPDTNTASFLKPGKDLEIEEALGRLPSDQRACLILHYVEGFRYREIGETLGISEDAVRKRVARGKQSFRKVYKGEDE